MERSLSVRIAEKIAERRGIDPTELAPPLYHVVDIEALEHLFATSNQSRGTVTPVLRFEYGGYIVTVEGTEGVDITVERTTERRCRPQTPNVAD